MATVETREQVTPGAGLLYDGFISYSHAADDLLAPRLQAGLQRFAKPWWKRRALRVFRDESSLSANPHLWSSITDALDRSGWFVLLLSPEAASSEWVNQEIEYWLANKDPERIIPVLTDGEFRWDGDVAGDAVPPALRGVFSDEPRWVDLRFARVEEQLDLQDPRFADAIADISAAIRGVAKDELASEEVREHRRTVRTAWAAGIVVLLLAVVAGVAALFALDQRNEANDQRLIAEENAAEAEASASEAQRQQAAAEQQAAIAQGRELTLEAEKAIESDPELSTHLALAAMTALRDAGGDSSQAVSVLRTAIEHDRVEGRMPGGEFVSVHPNGSLLATADGEAVAVRDIDTGEILERYPMEGAIPADVAFSPGGDLIAVALWNTTPPITVWNRATQESVSMGEEPAFYGPGSLSFGPDGELLAAWGVGVEVWSLEEQRGVFEDPLGAGPAFGSSGLLAYAVRSADEDGEATALTEVQIVDPATWQIVSTLQTELDPPVGANGCCGLSWSPGGGRIALSDQQVVVVLDVDTGEELARTSDLDRAWRAEWLGEGDTFLVGGEVVPKVIDAATGEIRFELLGLQEGIGSIGYDAVPGTSLVAVAALSPALGSLSEAVIFDTRPVIGELGGWLSPVEPGDRGEGTGFTVSGRAVVMGEFIDGSYVTADPLDGGNQRFYQGGTNLVYPPRMNARGNFITFADPSGVYTVRHADTGEVVYEAPGGWTIQGVSEDGTQAVISETGGDQAARLVSTIDGTLGPFLYESTEFGAASAIFSPDGQMVYATTCCILQAGLFDTQTGDPLVDLIETPFVHFFVAFGPDGDFIVMGSGHEYIVDVEQLLAGLPVEDVVLGEFTATDTNLSMVEVSPDGTMAITSDRDTPLRLWDLRTAQLISEFGGKPGPGAHFGGFHPTEPWLMVTTPPNIVRIHTRDIDELIAIAESRLSRDMTDQECEQYFRGPCRES